MRTIIVEKKSSKGIVMGKACLVEKQDLTPRQDMINEDQVEIEIRSYDKAVKKAIKELEVLAEDSEIFEAHVELAKDIALYESVMGRIKDGKENAELALWNTQKEYCAIFDAMDDEYMRERSADIKDICSRFMRRLKGLEETDFSRIKDKVILVAEDLAPSDTAGLNLDYVLGFITKLGGVTSHVSIMARSLGLPALVGVNEILEEVSENDFIILDANEGRIYINPSEEMIARFKVKAREFRDKQKVLEAASHLPAITKDGREVKVCANVGSLEDVKNMLKYSPDGIGLFRSEFLYMENTHFPTEEEQFEVYKEAAILCKKEIIIRTLDIGGDKELSYYEFEQEENPFLGFRAIRISLELEEVFKAQLRAILRASAFGEVKIMYPMIISMEELIKANEILKACKQELDSEGQDYRKDIQVGMMIETPASVLLCEEFAKHADFFSIGTNDLTQYILAADRGNKKISKLYNTFHPAVLRGIQRVINAGRKQNIEVGMCGEFASDEKGTKVLLGMGLDEFSVSANTIPEVKDRIRGMDYKEAEKTAAGLETAVTIDDVMKMI